MRIRIQKPTASPMGHRRRGSLAVELVLILPILLIFLLGMFEFSLLLSARQQLLAASREGARVAAQGADDQEVRLTVKRVLGKGSMGNAEVGVRRIAGETETLGAGRDRVEVVVRIPATRVVPDLLGWAGIKFAGHDLVAGAVMNRE
jgi:Flp pilus assembly protein TadG